MTTWRYQPVWITHDEDARSYQICQVHFDESGKLKAWSKELNLIPFGDDIEGLIHDLKLMQSDAQRWEPVEYHTLHVGMTFESKK